VNQVNINEKAGLTFALALKAFLRQDPDVIMVGEIRDKETGEIAIKAAQTGHLVLSTLHTNDAPTTLTRLMNMGIAPFNVATSVMLITAQRLALKLCAN
jgi:type IV pilus assembly protein PilB